MNLDSIKFGFFGEFCGFFELGNNSINILLVHFFRYWVGFVGEPVYLGNGDRGGGEGVLAVYVVFGDGPAAVEELYEDFSLFLVDCLGDLFPGGSLFLGENAAGAGSAVGKSGNGRRFGDY